MDIILVSIAIILSAVFPATLYFVLPLFLMYSLLIRKSVILNKISKIYVYLIIILLMYFLIHSFMSTGVRLVFIKGLFRYFSYFCFALYASTLSKRVVSVVFKFLILFFVVSFPLSLFQIEMNGRYQNIFAHANHFGYVLMICFYYILRYKPFRRSIQPVIIIIIIISLLLTLSSGAIITSLLLLFYHFFYKSRRNIFKLIFFSFVLLVIVFALSFLEKIYLQIDSFKFLDWDFINERARLYKPGGFGSLIWRIIYWVQILQSFFANNLLVILFGEGIDTLTKNNYIYSYMYTDPHNDYLKVLVEFGLSGLFLLLALLTRIYKILKRIDVLIMIIVPFFFANIIVSWPYNILIFLYFLNELYFQDTKLRKV